MASRVAEPPQVRLRGTDFKQQVAPRAELAAVKAALMVSLALEAEVGQPRERMALAASSREGLGCRAAQRKAALVFSLLEGRGQTPLGYLAVLA